MSAPVSRQQGYERNDVRLNGQAATFAQHGIGTDYTTLTSMRESANAEAPSFLCGCFTSLVNWIRELFLGCFGARANQTETRAERAITHERLIQKGHEFIDVQFNQSGLTFPLKAIVTIQFNDQILAMPHSDVIADLSEFKAEAKRVLTQTLQSQDLQGDVRLNVETHFLNNTSPNPDVFVYSMRSINNGINLRTEETTDGNGNADAMSARQVAVYFTAHTNRNEQILRELGRFLFPRQTTTGSV
ncbi:MAG: hypothetical protein JSR39_08000 [Verrucomicrobia bacterium]|nr:hypothetical protein [Verrucomicrobiota bacterium]